MDRDEPDRDSRSIGLCTYMYVTKSPDKYCRRTYGTFSAFSGLQNTVYDPSSSVVSGLESLIGMLPHPNTMTRSTCFLTPV